MQRPIRARKKISAMQNLRKTNKETIKSAVIDRLKNIYDPEIPVNIYDKRQLYHLKRDTISRHGADDSFDEYKNIQKQTTVRVTGYTADGKWSRIMLDNGVMTFVKSDSLEQGIVKEIPLWSKIYKEE